MTWDCGSGSASPTQKQRGLGRDSDCIIYFVVGKILFL